MFVAITKITEQGKPLYCINPKESTFDLEKAFTFLTREEGVQAVNEANTHWGTGAVLVEIIKTECKLEERKIEIVEEDVDLKAG